MSVAVGTWSPGPLRAVRRAWLLAERRLTARTPLRDGQRQRARLLLRVMALFFVIYVAWLPYELVYYGSSNLWVAAGLVAGLVAGLGTLSLLARTDLASHVLVAGIVVAVMTSARYRFGGAGLEVTGALVVVPFISAVFAGWKGGALWGGVSVALVGYTTSNYLSGQGWPIANGEPTRTLLFATAQVMIFVFAVGLVVFYERSHARTRQALQRALQRAQSADRAKSEFMASMSHEIRTPMNGVLGMLHLLLDGKVEGEDRELAQAAHRSAEVLLSVLNEVLDYSKLDSGKVELEALPVDLVEVAEDVAELMSGAAVEKHVELAVRCSPSLPARVICDGTRLRQVLLNLVANALKFTARGHVLLEVEGRVEGGRARVELRVSDTGVGIPADKLESIFRPFVQADTSTTRRFGGTGLGLTIVRRLVEAMGGDVRVTSTPGVGSVFTVQLELPVHQPEAVPPGRAEALRGLRVLVAGQSEVSCRVMRELVLGWGLREACLPPGADVLGTLREATGQGDPFQLALVAVPDGGVGAEVLGPACREDPRLAQVGLIMVTRAGAQGLDALMQRCGFDARIVTPVRRARLLEALLQARAVRAPLPDAAPRPEATVPRAPPAPARHPRVLLADDDTVSREVARRLLERQGCRVDTAVNGREALELAARGGYELVFLDCHMPELDGYETARAIRGLPGALAEVPIIALTADALTGARAHALKAGMDDYLSKPVRPPELAAMLSTWAGPAQRPTRR